MGMLTAVVGVLIGITSWSVVSNLQVCILKAVHASARLSDIQLQAMEVEVCHERYNVSTGRVNARLVGSKGSQDTV
jgi:hypothetical protein